MNDIPPNKVWHIGDLVRLQDGGGPLNGTSGVVYKLRSNGSVVYVQYERDGRRDVFVAFSGELERADRNTT